MTDKNKSLKGLMLTGIAAGLCFSNPLTSAEKQEKSETLMDLAAKTGGNVTYHLMTEDELLLQLDSEGTKVYNSLSPEGKKLALETASRTCAGFNSCKGLNACAGEHNKCAGKGTCKGTSICGISDPNLAVKLAAKKMEEKRLEAQGGKKSSTTEPSKK